MEDFNWYRFGLLTVPVAIPGVSVGEDDVRDGGVEVWSRFVSKSLVISRFRFGDEDDDFNPFPII